MEMTTAGIDDEKVSPTFNPKYTFEAVKIIVKILPKSKPRKVSSGKEYAFCIFPRIISS